MQFSQQKVCLVGAVICHKKAGDDACAHLECIKKTGNCLHEAGLRLHHLPDFVVSTKIISPLVNVSYHRNYSALICCFACLFLVY